MKDSSPAPAPSALPTSHSCRPLQRPHPRQAPLLPPTPFHPVDVQVEKPSPSLARITVTVPAEEFQGEYERGLQHERSRVNMKGFRPGKAPLQMIEKKVGSELKDGLQRHYIEQAFRQAQEEHSIKPFNNPRIPKDDAQLAEDGSFEVSFEISLRPEVVLGDYKNLPIESELEPTTEDSVDRAIDDLRQQHARPEPAGDDGLKEDGMALADVNFLYGEEVVFERTGLRLGVPQAPPGIDQASWQEALIGKQEGEQFTIDITLPDALDKEEARGKPGTCAVSISKVFDMLPPSDDELCKGSEVEDMQAFRAKLREHLENSAQTQEQTRQETALLDRVLTDARCEIPGGVLDEQAEVRLEQFAQELEQRKVPEEERGAALEEQRPLARQEAERGLRALLVVEALAEVESLEVSSEAMNAELAQIAERNGTDIEEVRKYYSEQNMFQQMAVELLERMVRTFLREQAEVKDPA